MVNDEISASLQWIVYLRGLDVIVEVVSESLNMGDGLVSPLWSKMPREQDYPLLMLSSGNLIGFSYRTSRIQPLHCYRQTALALLEAQGAARYGTKPAGHFVSLFVGHRQIPGVSVSKQ